MHKNKPALLVFLKTAFLLATLSSCTGTKESGAADSENLSILEASLENWQSGRPGGENGTSYRFTAVINTVNAIQFDNVWIREKAISLPLTPGRLKGPATNEAFTFSKGDTIALYAVVSSETLPEKAGAPAGLVGEAIISYSIKGKKGHKAIPAFTIKQTDPKPQ